MQIQIGGYFVTMHMEAKDFITLFMMTQPIISPFQSIPFFESVLSHLLQPCILENCKQIRELDLN